MTKRVSWKQKNKKQQVSPLTLIILIIAAVGIVAYAAVNYFFHLNFNVNNTRGISVAGSWTGDNIEGKEVVPGSTFQLNQQIKNNSTESVYVFVRIDTEENVYKISNLDPSWVVVKEDSGMILLAYGTSTTMVQLPPDQVVDVSGTLTLNVSNATFAGLEDSALDFSIHACGIAVSKCGPYIAPPYVYDCYIDNGGK